MPEDGGYLGLALNVGINTKAVLMVWQFSVFLNAQKYGFLKKTQVKIDYIRKAYEALISEDMKSHNWIQKLVPFTSWINIFGHFFSLLLWTVLPLKPLEILT